MERDQWFPVQFWEAIRFWSGLLCGRSARTRQTSRDVVWNEGEDRQARLVLCPFLEREREFGRILELTVPVKVTETSIFVLRLQTATRIHTSRLPTNDSRVAVQSDGPAPCGESSGSLHRGPLRVREKGWNPSPEDFVRLLKVASGRRMIDCMRTEPRVGGIPQRKADTPSGRCGAAANSGWHTRLRMSGPWWTVDLRLQRQGNGACSPVKMACAGPLEVESAILVAGLGLPTRANSQSPGASSPSKLVKLCLPRKQSTPWSRLSQFHEDTAETSCNATSSVGPVRMSARLVITSSAAAPTTTPANLWSGSERKKVGATFS